MELNYTRNGDYLIPDICLCEQTVKPLGKYGLMRKKFWRTTAPSLHPACRVGDALCPLR